MILHYLIQGSPVTPTVLCVGHDIFSGIKAAPGYFHICTQSSPRKGNSHGIWDVPSISGLRYSKSNIAWGHYGPHGTLSVNREKAGNVRNFGLLFNFYHFFLYFAAKDVGAYFGLLYNFYHFFSFCSEGRLNGWCECRAWITTKITITGTFFGKAIAMMDAKNWQNCWDGK